MLSKLDLGNVRIKYMIRDTIAVNVWDNIMNNVSVNVYGIERVIFSNNILNEIIHIIIRSLIDVK